MQPSTTVDSAFYSKMSISFRAGSDKNNAAYQVSSHTGLQSLLNA